MHSACLSIYECENWLLTDSLLSLLEDFLAEIGKKILHLPKYHANLCPLIALQGYNGFLCDIIFSLGNCVSLAVFSTLIATVFNALREQEQGPLIIEQCKLLEQAYHTNTTLVFIEGNITISIMRRDLLKADQDNIWSMIIASNHCIEQSPGLSCGTSLATMVFKVQGHLRLFSKHSLLTFVVALTATLASQESIFGECNILCSPLC